MAVVANTAPSNNPPRSPGPEAANAIPAPSCEGLFERARWAYEHLPHQIDRLLDVGCHDGATTAALSSRARSTIAIDVNLSALRIGHARYPNVRFAAASANALPFTTGTFDCVVFSEVLEHVPTVMETDCIVELHRVLRPGGTLLFTTPHRGSFWWLDPLMFKTHARRLGRIFRRRASEEKGHKHYTVRELRALMASHFAVDRVDRRGCVLYPLAYWGHLATVGRLSQMSRLWRYMMDVDYSHEHGDAAYNVCIVARPR
jgi:2-polyprenyl-3-methyl-5-hydroxy-6-metoxy-1,4-benzoquinol methylase